MKKIFTLFIVWLCILSLFTGCAGTPDSSGSKEGEEKNDDSLYAENLIASPIYPEMTAYPDENAYFDEKTGEFDDDGFCEAYDAWEADRDKQRRDTSVYSEKLEQFFISAAPELLSGGDGENTVCSPVNIYMALCMLAELTDSNSRSQILSLLGADSIEEVRETASAIWNANYCDDGAVTSVLSNSLWLNDSVNFEEKTLNTLADNYYASSFSGEMGSDEFSKALRAWLNSQTNGLLEDAAGGISLNPETVLALASTIYFRAKWNNEFAESATKEAVFHGKNGDITCDFMYQSNSRSYYRGDGFAAVSQSLTESGCMWLILPDEGTETEDLLKNSDVLDMLSAKQTKMQNNVTSLIVNLALPKFDVSSSMDLCAKLQSLGVTDVFDSSVSDFSPITGDTDEIFLSQASHAARVKVDEKGCEAAAFTVMNTDTAAALPEDEVDFILDRPFMFVIKGEDGSPLFAGIVNCPVEN